MEANEVDILASAVLRDLEQIEDAQKSRCLCQGGSDIWETDRLDGIHHNHAIVHRITAAYLHVRTRPYPDTACDFSAANPVAQTFGENHEGELTENLKPVQPFGRS